MRFDEDTTWISFYETSQSNHMPANDRGTACGMHGAGLTELDQVGVETGQGSADLHTGVVVATTMLTQLPHEGGLILATKIEHFVSRLTALRRTLRRQLWRFCLDFFQDGRVVSCIKRSSRSFTSAARMRLRESFSAPIVGMVRNVFENVYFKFTNRQSGNGAERFLKRYILRSQDMTVKWYVAIENEHRD